MPTDPRVVDELRTLDSLGRRVDALLHAALEDPDAVRSALDSLGLSSPHSEDAARAELARLKQFSGAENRYEVEGELARGGMSTVWRVRDRALGRSLAMKVASTRAGVLPRFLAEARLTGRLDHPGIVPVHDLGVDAEGRACFSMPLVHGLTFTEVIDMARDGAESWTPTRALEVLLKVCDTVAYAHSLSVVHRDLKPDNVLVGRFGQVYVVDWGLARGTRSVAESPGDPAQFDTGLPDLHTQAGAVLGTPAYMAPEQAAGRHDEVGPCSDVYAIGAVLYRLLTGFAPYCDTEDRHSTRAVLAAALAGPPKDAEALAPDVDAELAAICRKAMQRERAARYDSVAALSDDLRAYLEGRVVRAHAGGVWVQLRKWIRRNRALTVASCVALSTFVVGLVAFGWSELRRIEQLELSTADIRFESDRRAPAALRDSARQLWPATPALIPALEAWLDEASELLSRREDYVRERDALRSAGRPAEPTHPREAAVRAKLEAEFAGLKSEVEGSLSDARDMSQRAFGPGRQEGIDFARARVDSLSLRIQAAEQGLSRPLAWEHADPSAEERCAALADLVEAIDELGDPSEGLIADVEARLSRARAIPTRVESEADPAWQAAIEDIADPQSSPHYAGLSIVPQVGLEPLRRNPVSNLWEFFVLGSGERPRGSDDGNYAMGPRTGIVLVLIPGGPTRMGVRAIDPLPTWALTEGARPYGPLRYLELDPYFLSKYEMTQGQWLLATRRNPAYFHAGTTFEVAKQVMTFDLRYPVESISWLDAAEQMRRLGLLLPTEARLEHAYRAGGEGWWSIPDMPNCLVSGFNSIHYSDDPGRLDLVQGYLPFDGFHCAAPVGWFPANLWGLHEIYGNVSEWALDVFAGGYDYPLRAGDGLHMAPESGLRVTRGGTWGHPIQNNNNYARDDKQPGYLVWSLGVRPARDVDR